MNAKCVSGAIALVLAAGGVMGGVLAPGATIPLSGTRFADDNELGGSSRWDESTPFEIRNATGDVFISGNLQDSVSVSGVTALLIFNRNIRDVSSSSGTARIVGIAANHFGGLDLTADFRPDSIGTIDAVGASRSGGTGDVVSFDFTGAGLGNGEEAHTCYAKTNANGFGVGASLTISAVEFTGGPEFSVVIENITKPQLLPTDRVIVTSFKQLSSSRFEIQFLSVTASNYDIFGATSLEGPWTYQGDEIGGFNPRTFLVVISGGVTGQPRKFFRIDAVP